MDPDRAKIVALFLTLDSETSDEEEEELLLLNKKTRESRHSIFANRNTEGVYEVLINRHLVDNDTKFKEYFRLSPTLFSKILEGIESELIVQPSPRYPKPIEPRLKLCLLLR